MSDSYDILKTLNQDELIARLLHQQEEIQMGRAFSHISEDVDNDATLQWQGRNRFLSEKVIPVQLEQSLPDSLCPDKGDHRIINGDNLSVMTSLLAELRGGRDKGVDVIYLDPPYNTGSDTFSYNDNYRFTPAEVRQLKRKTKQTEKVVGIDDPSRHTKWINHIAPRLWAARKLLKSTGVIIVSIDEHELPRLWMLMEEMFGEKNRIATLIWERSRKNDARYISEGHEYMLVWARNKEELDSVTRKKGKWREVKPGLEPFVEEYTRLRENHKNEADHAQRLEALPNTGGGCIGRHDPNLSQSAVQRKV
jgi:adenine-specific DNA-methyltransferase